MQNAQPTADNAQPKLYRIKVLHGGPKDSHTSTETYLIAPDDAAVAEWINTTKVSGYWFEENADEPDTRYDDETETDMSFREYVMKNRGDLEDEEGWSDAYYGVTKWGWEPVEATAEDMAVLIRLGIAVTATTQP